MTGTAGALMATLLVAHFLADFTPLSTPRMLEAKATATSPGWILLHAGVHAVLISLAVWAVARPGWSLIGVAFGVELSTHFAIDYVRAKLGVRIPSLADASERPFWHALGLDQLAHGLVLVAIAALVLA